MEKDQKRRQSARLAKIEISPVKKLCTTPATRKPRKSSVNNTKSLNTPRRAGALIIQEKLSSRRSSRISNLSDQTQVSQKTKKQLKKKPGPKKTAKPTQKVQLISEMEISDSSTISSSVGSDNPEAYISESSSESELEPSDLEESVQNFSDEDLSDISLKPKKKKQKLNRKIIKRTFTLQKREIRIETGTDLQKAAKRLHLSEEPDSLPCREDEFDELYSHVYSALQENTGCCIYVSGVPGTGKTATFRAVLRQLMADEEISEFDFVEINGMRITEAKDAYTTLWLGLTGDRVSPSHAELLLTQKFTSPATKNKMCIVLVDELDLILTKKQSVVYNFFDWPNHTKSKMIVVAIANTMDLPERMLSNKVSSRLGLNRIVFEPYRFKQMVEICESRLQGLNVFEPQVLEFCARKVALVSGDARRCLDICRRAVELFQEAETPETNNLIPMVYIEEALKEMNTSKAVVSVKNSSLHQQIFLLSVLNMIKKTGLMDVDFDSVQAEYRDICTMARVKIPSTSLLYSVCQSLGEFKLLLVEIGKLGMPQQKLKINVDRNDILRGIEIAKHPKLISTIKRFKR